MEKATRQVVMGARELVSERGTHTRISHERENGRARVKEMGNQRTDCQGNGIPIGHQPIQRKEPYRLLVIRIPSCVWQLDGKIQLSLSNSYCICASGACSFDCEAGSTMFVRRHNK